MEFDDLKTSVSTDGAVATITLDRPPANIMSANTITELQTALKELDGDQRKTIVIRSDNERMFSGGVEVEDHIGDALPEMLERFGNLFETMRDLSTPTLAAVNGPALGGGCELVAGCDLAIATESATLGQPEINLATFPPVAAALFPSIMGEKDAFELIFTGDDIDAETAESIGLVNEVVPSEELDDAVDRMTDRLAENSGLVLGMAKEAFYETVDQASFADALEVANEHAIDITSTEEGQEGLTAFMEDREPEWAY